MEYNTYNLNNFTVKELQNLCKEKHIRKYSKLRKKELIDLILSFKQDTYQTKNELI